MSVYLQDGVDSLRWVWDPDGKLSSRSAYAAFHAGGVVASAARDHVRPSPVYDYTGL